MEESQTRATSTLGRFIRERREALGLSQQTLADRLTTRSGRPMAVSQVSRFERLMPPGWLPKPYILNALADALEVSRAELIAVARPDAATDPDDALALLGQWQATLVTLDLQPEVAAFLEGAIAQARRLERSLRERDRG